MTITWKCSRCKNELEEEEIRAGVCKKCLEEGLRDIFPASKTCQPVGGLIIPKSRCCGAPIKKTEGLIVEICTKCKKPNPPEPVYGK
jgi:hypothetical protein